MLLTREENLLGYQDGIKKYTYKDKYTYNGYIETIDLEEYLCGVVPSEIRPWAHSKYYKTSSIAPSKEDAQLNHKQAMMAQAIVARTYAKNWIDNRNNYQFDVTDRSGHHQAYYKNKIDKNSTDAVYATAGVIMTYNGKVLKGAQFCANNGGYCHPDDRYQYLSLKRDDWTMNDILLENPNAKIDPTTGKYEGAMYGHGSGLSQDGTTWASQHGVNYKNILKFYFEGIKFKKIKKATKESDKVMKFKIRKCIFTKNPCYADNINKNLMGTPIGIVVHDTGAGNPWLNRYLPNTDNVIGEKQYKNTNKYDNHWNQEKIGDKKLSKCVHAFIGKGVDEKVYTYQTLPWDMKGWHSGSGSLGSSQSANKLGYIGFEICDDGYSDEDYFKECYRQAVELCAYLCKKYKIPIDKVICHAEAHAQGIGSNHGDVLKWFPKFGKSMELFRSDVKQKIIESNKYSIGLKRKLESMRKRLGQLF